MTARLEPGETAVLAALAGQLIELLDERAAESPTDVLLAQLGIGGASAPPLDPALARLLPDAYRDDSEASSEHRQLTELGLVDRKIANARAVVATLNGGMLVVLDPPAAQSWLRHLTDLRLVLAARLQIEGDGDAGSGDDRMLDLYDWLGYLQGTLVECLE
ncbi:MAG: DUF2017 domain-containing protein [Salinibacterium sp.]|nr:DUF2017 domain-containing protein [Salinibacterium sp.]